MRCRKQHRQPQRRRGGRCQEQRLTAAAAGGAAARGGLGSSAAAAAQQQLQREHQPHNRTAGPAPSMSCLPLLLILLLLLRPPLRLHASNGRSKAKWLLRGLQRGTCCSRRRRVARAAAGARDIHDTPPARAPAPASPSTPPCASPSAPSPKPFLGRQVGELLHLHMSDSGQCVNRTNAALECSLPL